MLHWRLRPTLLGMFLAGLLIGAFWLSLQRELFDDPCSTVVFDCDGNLLGARIADDGQWRFPPCDSVPFKFKKCIVLFEDRHFYRHPGVNPLSLIRAAYQNFMSGEIVSGGSTITMQTIRLSRRGKPRTIFQKAIEIGLSVHLEIAKTKDEILALYASHAPFGGNVVGIEAAAWRYFGRSPDNLSWAEAAMLAVLPNAPGLIHPGRNRGELEIKRNFLLGKLLIAGVIDGTTYRLSLREPLPEKPLPLPDPAPHLTARMDREHHGRISHTTLNINLQNQVSEVMERYCEMYRHNGIHNAAVMVVQVNDGRVVSYVGNTAGDASGNDGCHVDVITSARSTGSILKPLLYAAMLGDGELLPSSLVADIPTTISSYSPKNFNVTYDGAVPANEALIRSLNVPAVRMLSDYGLYRFYEKLKRSGFSTLVYDADHYGLSLILGGAEVSLWDLCRVYAGLARQVNSYPASAKNEGRVFGEPLLLQEKGIERSDPAVFDVAAVYHTFEAMRKVRRPEAEAGWEWFTSARSVAWKTGTSFGFRDAWAVGVTPDYVVGVWVGNADGEGRPGLTGIATAAPVMFEVFDLLPATGWFEPPWDEMSKIPVCRHSGMRPSVHCPDIDSIWVPNACLNTRACPWHRLIHLDSSGRFRVSSDCYPPAMMQTGSWFVLPPAMAWFYRSKNPFYKSMPPWLPGCYRNEQASMQLIWPDQPSKIYIPREIDGKVGETVFEIAHSSPGNKVFWYVDDDYHGATINIHKMGLHPEPGRHTLTLVDENGNFLRTAFEIVSKK
ncbi:MAG: penicillin-binding protein 1C [Bacteroidales bacterium]